MRWPLGLYRVAGNSMLPTYAPGDLLLGWRWFTPRVGQVVTARTDHPVIKRIVSAGPHGYELMGDHPVSSRYQDITARQMEAVMVLRLSRVNERAS